MTRVRFGDHGYTLDFLVNTDFTDPEKRDFSCEDESKGF